MTIFNAALEDSLMWDGRAETLESQALLPFRTPAEFDLPVNEAVVRLKLAGYSKLFFAAYGGDVTGESLGKALAAYERTLIAGDSPFDRFLFEKNLNAISSSAERGFATFLRVGCDSCHLIMTPGLHPFAMHTVTFTDEKFHNLGIGTDQVHPDPGRQAVTGDPHDWGAFRTPSLRNVFLTAPYFHDGSAATLLDVIEFYNRGGKHNRNLDPALHPLNLSQTEKLDLVEFLKSLTSREAERFTEEEAKADSR